MSETQNTEAPFTWENRHSSMNIEVVWFLGQTPFKLYSGITYVVLNLCTWFPLKPFLQIYRNQDYLITFQGCIFQIVHEDAVANVCGYMLLYDRNLRSCTW